MNSASDYPLDKVREEFDDTLSAVNEWWFYPINGGSMNKVNQYVFYELGTLLSGLRRLHGEMTFNETLMPLLRASNSLRKFLLHTNAIPLRLSRSVAQALKNLVDEEFATKNDDGSELDWKKK